MANAFAGDLLPSELVATVSGMSGTGAGIGTILSTYLIGYVSDRYSFGPVLIGASLVPLLAMALVLLLVRNTAESGQGRVRRISENGASDERLAVIGWLVNVCGMR